MTKIDENIKSLSMMKMEKNFVGVNDKGYPRQPYDEFPIYDIQWYNDGGGIQAKPSDESLVGFILREVNELEFACQWNFGRCREGLLDTEKCLEVLHEIADVSNMLDFLYEAVLRKMIVCGELRNEM